MKEDVPSNSLPSESQQLGESNGWSPVALGLATSVLPIAAGTVEFTGAAIEHWDLIKYITGGMTLAGAAALVAVCLKQARTIASYRRATAQREDASVVEVCSLHHSCILRDNVTNLRQLGYSGLDDEVVRFIDLRKSGAIHASNVLEYIGTAQRLRDNEAASWHILYATPNAIQIYTNGTHHKWIQDEETVTDTRFRRKRLMIITDDGDAAYRAKVKYLTGILDKTSELLVVTKKSLVDYRLSHLLRDFGIFKDKYSGCLEALLSFGICDYGEIFSAAPSGDYSTENLDYVKRLIDQFEVAWESGPLRRAAETTKRAYMESSDD